jgi:DNA replication protein DnaC
MREAVPSIECPLCGGTGWKTSSSSGKVRTVERCECRLTVRSARLLEQAEVPSQYAHCTLDNFDVSFPDATESLRNALFFARRFVEKYLAETTGMLIWGGCGTGKTHLAIAILRALVLQKGARCLFRGYSALLRQIQATFSRQVVADEETGVVLTEYSLVQDVIQAEVLVLDDLGGEISGLWALNMVYHIINERYNQRRTTIITTNFPLDAPEWIAEGARNTPAHEVMKPESLRRRIGERACSRITELCPRRVELYGSDYRQIKSAR